MPALKEMIVTIMHDGEIKIETKGFTGQACIKETEAIKTLLGKETSRELTPTYYERNGVKTSRHLPICG